jgi:hypothetical protein
MVCLLLRDSAVPIDYQRAERPRQAMAIGVPILYNLAMSVQEATLGNIADFA